jgi:hypothetical protein
MVQSHDDLAKALIELVQQHSQELPRKAEKLLRNGDAILKLQQHGLTEIGISPGLYDGVVCHVDRTDLPKVRKAVGWLRKTHTCVSNADDRTVRVYLEADAYPGVQIAFKTVLPENGRCRIETHYYKNASLVCAR